jgi:hypothetical protein
MDTVTILRELWRRRMLVLGVGIVAVLAGLLIMYQATFPPKSRQHSVGVATTSILVDTPSSAVVDVAPKGSDTLGVRANVLASVMVDGDVKAEIAQAAGLNPADIVGVAKSGGTNQPVTTPASPKDPNAPVFTTQVLTDNTQDALPIIQVQAQAQDAATATKLANGAVVGLRNYLSTKAAAERIPDAQRLQVNGLGVSQAHTISQGPSKIIAVIAMIVVFFLGCFAILGVVALIRNWRAADEREAWVKEDLPFGIADDLGAEEGGETAPRQAPLAKNDGAWGDDWLEPDYPSLVAARPAGEQDPQDGGDDSHLRSA